MKIYVVLHTDIYIYIYAYKLSKTHKQGQSVIGSHFWRIFVESGASDKLVQIAPISLWLMLLVTHEIKASMSMSLILLFHYGSNWGL